MNILPFSQKKLYWILQIGGWSFLFFYDILKWLGVRSNYTIESITFLLLYYACALFVSHGLRYAYLKLLKKKVRVGYILFYIVLLTYFASLISMVAQIGIDIAEYVYIFKERTLQEQLNRYLATRLYLYTLFFQPQYIMWSFAYFGIKMWLDMLKQKKMAEDAISYARDAQLQTLEYQLNPHFLFNSLNSIQVLIDENKDAAKDTIDELSEILRYSLQNSELRFQPLKKELFIIKKYLSIEQKRYENKLIVNYNVSNDALSFPVLSFLIQPFIENAIKFGMKTSKLPLKINIDAIVINDELKIEISNTGIWYNNKSNTNIDIDIVGTGNGISNIRKRLEHAYPNEHSLEIFEGIGTVIVKLIIKKGYAKN
ncbi:sensor histidine kinase [Bacteroidota bacterium]